MTAHFQILISHWRDTTQTDFRTDASNTEALYLLLYNYLEQLDSDQITELLAREQHALVIFCSKKSI